jgi:hypothetical protein
MDASDYSGFTGADFCCDAEFYVRLSACIRVTQRKAKPFKIARAIWGETPRN